MILQWIYWEDATDGAQTDAHSCSTSSGSTIIDHLLRSIDRFLDLNRVRLTTDSKSAP